MSSQKMSALRRTSGEFFLLFSLNFKYTNNLKKNIFHNIQHTRFISQQQIYNRLCSILMRYFAVYMIQRDLVTGDMLSYKYLVLHVNCLLL